MVRNFSKTDRQTVNDFFHESLKHRRQLLLALLVPFSTLCFSALVPYFIGNILARLTVPDAAIANLFLWLIAFGFIGVLTNRIGFKNLMLLNAKTMRSLQEKAFTALTRRSLGFHSNHVSGKLVSDLSDYPQAYSQLVMNFFVSLLPFAVTVVGGTLLVFINSWQIGLIILLMSLVIIIWAIWQSQIRFHLRTRRHTAGKAVLSHIGDNITNISTVKSFAAETKELEQHQKLANNLMEYRSHDWSLVATDGSNRFAVLFLFQLAFVSYLVLSIRSDPSLLGVGIFAFTYTITLLNRLFQINEIIRAIEESLLNASPLTKYLREPAEIVDSIDAQLLFVDKGAISLDAVSFSYQEKTGTTQVFSDLSLDIPAGQKVGLVGPSGGGKSTLMRLLLRFEEPQSGRIVIDGQDISKIKQDSLRAHIAYVSQEPLLFHRSIRENLLYGNPSASEQDMRQAAKDAYALEFVESLHHGFDTVVGERGVKLSGGQRQRIAIARAMLKDAPILLLDEATSALDSESEKLIQSALKNLMKSRTVIVIAHRLSTIHSLDRIVVVDKGKLAEQGTHKSLLRKKGLYATLWAHQSGGFLED